MMALSAEDVADLRRWLISGAIIVLAHGAIAATMVSWRDEIEPAEPAAAIVIEFAPVPVAPVAPQADIAPGPEQVMSDASPDKPVERVVEQKVEEKVASRPVEEPPPEIKPALIPRSESNRRSRSLPPRSAKSRARRHRQPRRRRPFQSRLLRSRPRPRRAGSPPTIRMRCRHGRRRSWRCSSATSAIRRPLNLAASKGSPRSSLASTGTGG